jgi:S-adenosylmethionine synthetase
MARHVAKSLVASGLCRRCEIQFSYAIGVPFPISVLVDTFGTGNRDDGELERIVQEKFDLSPAGIIGDLDLLRPIYRASMNYGHFGKDSVPGNHCRALDRSRTASFSSTARSKGGFLFFISIK